MMNWMLWQIQFGIIQSRFYESDYKNVTQKLLYENMDYDYAVENGIAIVAKSKVFLYRE